MPSQLDEPEVSTPSQSLDAPIEAEPLAIQSALASTSGADQAKVGRGAVQKAGGEIRSVDGGEETVVKLDELGPVIVNSDGVGDVWLYCR